MGTIAEATLADGRKLPYVITDDPPRGGMKYTYFAPDRSYVVQFFNNPAVAADPNTHRRLEAIIGKYNPTRPEALGGAPGSSEAMAAYFSTRFCWPTAIVRSPEFGVVCPAYPANFFFTEEASTVLPLRGKDKRSKWFTSARNRQYLEPEEIGDFRAMIRMSITLARAVRRMHQAGLAHSDLSCNNVLIDPKSGGCVVIDIDSLVVPGLFPPEVVGTHGYIAPEVLETMDLPSGDPGRKLPSSYTDLHALAVLLYEYLLMRHPLEGPKIYSPRSPEEDDFLAFGPRATFIEDPHDASNRPPDLYLTIQDLGPILADLFSRAFVDGLHHPDARPTAMEWEKGLEKTWDLLHPCENPDCAARWFILYDPGRPVCPFCGTRVRKENILRLRLKSPLRGRAGQWMQVGEMDLYDHMPLFQWHVRADVFPGEKADQTPQAYVCRHQGQWLLVNRRVRGMTSPGGRTVPRGQALPLRPGAVFRACGGERTYLMEVSAPR